MTAHLKLWPASLRATRNHGHSRGLFERYWCSRSSWLDQHRDSAHCFGAFEFRNGYPTPEVARALLATNAAAQDAADTAEELRARCRAYCHFALEHPRLYELMFQADLPLTLRDAPDQTPGRRSFDNLVGAVRRCLDARLAPAHDDPFRLASLIWTAEHGLVLARISWPTFPWASIDALGDEMVTRMMRFHSTGSE